MAKTIYDHQKKAAQPANLEVSESKTDGNKFFVKSGNNTYTVEVEYPERNENVRTFKCNCKREDLCKHARAVIEYIDGLDEAYEVVLALRQATEKYVANQGGKG